MEKWYPRHIVEAKEELEKNLKACDTVIEVIDARAPFASKNRELPKYTVGKNRILVINKVDLIEPKIAASLEQYFRKEYRYVLSMSATEFTNLKKLFQILDEIFTKKKEKMARKGINAFAIRVIVLGIPNVGKSKIINTLTGRKIAKVADTPGITTGRQWIKILSNVDLLDTPGILWTNNTKNELKKLALIKAHKDSEENFREGAIHLLEIISVSKAIKTYGLDLPLSVEIDVVLDKMAEVFKISIDNVCNKIVSDFRNGLLGKISLESA